MGHRQRLLALVAVFALLAASCGDDDGDDSQSTSEPTTATTGSEATATTDPDSPDATVEELEYDPDGVLRLAASLIELHWDPTLAVSAGGYSFTGMLVYEPLLRGYFDRQDEPGLATDVTVVDDSTIDVEIREGAVFTDDTPVDAAAVKYSLERNRDNPGTAFRPQIADLSSVEVTGDHSVRITLATPTAPTWVPLLAGPEGVIVSPTAAEDPAIDLDTTPVGAGPFILESVVPEQRAELVKNPDYWDADNIKVAGIELIHVETGPPQVTALLSEAVDYIGATLVELEALSTSDIAYEVVASPTSVLYVHICKTMPPFDDVRVRQAMNYATDREAVSELLTGGLGEPVWGLWASGTTFHEPELDGIYEHDVERARELLAEAGYADGFEADIIPQPDDLNLQYAQVLAEQWSEVGIDLNIVTSSNYVQDLLVDKTAPLGTASVARPGLERLTGHYASEHLANFCSYSDPELQATIDELVSVPADSDEARELWSEAQHFVAENALNVWTLFLPLGAGWNDDRIGGVDLTIVGAVPPFPHLKEIYVKP